VGDRAKVIFVTYLFFIVGGVVAADHAPALLAWVRGNGRIVAAIVAGGALLQAAWFFAVLATGALPNAGSKPIQPVMIVWAACAGLGFLWLGARWADRRVPGRPLDRAIATASDISFAIFLVHPLLLWALEWAAPALGLPDHGPLVSLVFYLIVVAIATGIGLVARRTPLSLVVTGRRWARRRGAPS
jgi:peptidoglycan/LPS O-acetylase OafA/YrhL